MHATLASTIQIFEEYFCYSVSKLCQYRPVHSMNLAVSGSLRLLISSLLRRKTAPDPRRGSRHVTMSNCPTAHEFQKRDEAVPFAALQCALHICLRCLSLTVAWGALAQCLHHCIRCQRVLFVTLAPHGTSCCTLNMSAFCKVCHRLVNRMLESIKCLTSARCFCKDLHQASGAAEALHFDQGHEQASSCSQRSMMKL